MRIKFLPPPPTQNSLLRIPSATRCRMEALTKENLVGAKIAGTAISRTFTPLGKRKTGLLGKDLSFSAPGSLYPWWTHAPLVQEEFWVYSFLMPELLPSFLLGDLDRSCLERGLSKSMDFAIDVGVHVTLVPAGVSEGTPAGAL